MTRARDIANLGNNTTNLETIDTVYSAGGLTGRNLIINGAMTVAQRGTSATTSNYATVDRFRFDRANTDEFAWTQTQQSVTDLAGFSNSYRITTTTAESAIAADELAYVSQRIEAQNLQQLGYGTSSAKKVTLSFYVKSSVTGTFSTNIYQVDDSRIINAEYTINSANTWERKEITYAADQTGVIDNDNGVGFYVVWNLAVGSNYKGNAASGWEGYTTDNWAGSGTYTDAVITTTSATWEITGVQLEIGETSTPFEHEDYGTTLRKCQRYYLKYIDDAAYSDICNVAAYSTSAARGVLDMPSRMRTAPTLASSGAFQILGIGTVSSVSITTTGEESPVSITLGGSGYTSATGGVFRTNNDADAYIELDAEL